MSVGIATISKGLLQRAIENVVNNTAARPAFLATLQGNPPTPGMDWLDYLVAAEELDRAAARYVRDIWFPAWPSDYQAEAIMRQSLIEAIELANSLATPAQPFMPIDCHWIWTEDQTKFQVLLTYNTRQVTRILLTPPLPTKRDIPLLGLARYFAVKPRQHVSEDKEQLLPRDPRPPGATVPVEEDTMRTFLAMPRDPEAAWATVQLKAPE